MASAQNTTRRGRISLLLLRIAVPAVILGALGQANRLTAQDPVQAPAALPPALPVNAHLPPALPPALPMNTPAQPQPDAAPNSSLCLPNLPTVQSVPPRPAGEPNKDLGKGRDPVSSIVDHLSSTDSVFEVLVGQGRIMNFKQDLYVIKKDKDKNGKEIDVEVKAGFAIGDPTIISVSSLSSSFRQVRLTGHRMGVTDLSITMPDGQIYNFEVRVVADLHVLGAQLGCLFPTAKLKVGQVRDHVVIEGEALSRTQKFQILATVRSYLDSIKASQFQKSQEIEKVKEGEKGQEKPGQGGLAARPLPETYVIDLIRVPAGAESERDLERKREIETLYTQLQILFPDASLKVTLVPAGPGRSTENIVVEGQARDTAQVARIMDIIKASVADYKLRLSKQIQQDLARERSPEDDYPIRIGEKTELVKGPSSSSSATITGAQTPLQTMSQFIPEPKIINLIKVIGSQQVLLKVRIAELNRTAMRQIGSDFLAIDPRSGALFGTQIGGTTATATGSLQGIASTATAGATGITSVSAAQALTGAASNALSPVTTAFGILQGSHFDIFLSALRKNGLLKILAEPNLVAMHGQQASFLAGGSFPVPVPQVSGAAGSAPVVTVQFQQFGVSLNFTPLILDGDLIRLSVDPVVSTIDNSLGITLVAGGAAVPGLDIRQAHTVVEMRQGQTLAMAGLMQVSLDSSTARIPFLGDLPILGPFFSNTTSSRMEKELIVLVTPYLIEPMNEGQVHHTPGDEVNEPNDLEFFLLNRMEGRTGKDHRTTVEYDDPLHLLHHRIRLEETRVRGPHGYCEDK
jgi:pilus assembly protein CpaC